MMTFFAPASRCLAAASRFVNRPVDSITTSAPRSPHGSAAGSRSERTFTSRPSTTIPPSRSSTSPGNGPKTESYLSRWASVPESVMSLTATISMSALDSCAARNTLRPMRPKPLIPTRTDMMTPSSDSLVGGDEPYRPPSPPAARWPPCRAGKLGHRDPVDVAVLDLHEVVRLVAEAGGQVLGDGHGAMAPAGTADGHDQMRLALGDELGQQVLQERHEVAVELVQAAVEADVLDDVAVEAREGAKVRHVMRVGQEAHVEGEVGVARRAVLVTEGGEGDGELAGRGRREQLAGHLAAQAGRAQARGVDAHVRAVLDGREQLDLGADAVGD